MWSVAVIFKRPKLTLDANDSLASTCTICVYPRVCSPIRIYIPNRPAAVDRQWKVRQVGRTSKRGKSNGKPGSSKYGTRFAPLALPLYASAGSACGPWSREAILVIGTHLLGKASTHPRGGRRRLLHKCQPGRSLFRCVRRVAGPGVLLSLSWCIFKNGLVLHKAQRRLQSPCGALAPRRRGHRLALPKTGLRPSPYTVYRILTLIGASIRATWQVTRPARRPSTFAVSGFTAFRWPPATGQRTIYLYRL